MIPPPRHASADGLPSHSRSAASPVPIPVSPLHRDTIQIPIGSYNPSESLLGSSPIISPSSRLDTVSEFSDEVPTSAWLGRSGSGKLASSFPSSSGEMMTMKITGGGGGNTPKGSLTTASVVKALPRVSGDLKHLLIECVQVKIVGLVILAGIIYQEGGCASVDLSNVKEAPTRMLKIFKDSIG
ncbi:hypothetical protein COCNU_14G008660 [Cocos nucifera]|uniref:Uncharacterized protein n=1 Tax=Cocos nucifera TaxID=13894 RepID=A0A8K0NCK9_COCNU|nr:hypothetical protein COCNU_14G008660 [Cocos nucifera]